MKTKWAIILTCIIITIIIFIGCEKKQSTKEEVYSDFQKKISTMSSYTCIAEIKAVGNKNEQNYVFSHNYNKPNNYKLEILSPEHLKGKTIEYKANNIIIKNPEINDTIELTSTEINKPYMFIGDFIKTCLQNKNVDISLSYDKLILEMYIQGDNEYFNKQVLYVNSDTKTPEKMEILDKKGNVKFILKYKNFKWKK